MKTKLLLSILISVIYCSCTSIQRLPSVENIDEAVYGSYIKIKQRSGNVFFGELIAIDSNKIIVLTESENKIAIVTTSDVKAFTLKYANPKRYGWTFIEGVVLPILPFPDPDAGGPMPFHGYYCYITIPLNMILAGTFTAIANNSFVYKKRDITFAKLQMFARFPQGIPAGISLSSIR